MLNKPLFTIGAIGQDGNGKSTLLQAIAKVLAFKGQAHPLDFSEPELDAPQKGKKASKPDFVRFEYESETRRYQQLDFANRAAFLKTIFSSTTRLDGAILVVDSVNGISASDREQIRIVGRAGLPGLVVFLNKCDAVEDTDLIQVAEAEVRDALTKNTFGLANVSYVYGSALRILNSLSQSANTPEYWCISDLLDALDKTLPEMVSAPTNPPTGLHARFEAEFYMLPKEEVKRQMPLLTGVSPDFCFADVELEGHILLPDVKMVLPGDVARIRVKLIEPLAISGGLRFSVKENGRIIGNGIIAATLD